MSFAVGWLGALAVGALRRFRFLAQANDGDVWVPAGGACKRKPDVLGSMGELRWCLLVHSIMGDSDSGRHADAVFVERRWTLMSMGLRQGYG